ncbi:MAG TPA: tetratricopeptide repeat protein, partial [Kofleriaceae bacterium]
LARVLERRDPRDTRAFGLYDQACTGGYLPACTEIGRRYAAVGDQAHAIEVYRSACALHEPEACTRLGTLEEGLPGKAADAAAHHEQACTEDPGIACRSAGSLYTSGKLLPVDLNRASRLFEAGCSADDFTACAMRADLYRLHPGSPRDLARALALYDRACNAEIAWACVQAGHLYRRAGRTDESRQRYEKGCRGGDAEACHLAP